jgi:hypothetical protein
VVISQGEIWWADPRAPGLGFGDLWLLFKAMPLIRVASLQPFAFH